MIAPQTPWTVTAPTLTATIAPSPGAQQLAVALAATAAAHLRLPVLVANAGLGVSWRVDPE